jgi:5-methylcytosine-specific restriction protein A
MLAMTQEGHQQHVAAITHEWRKARTEFLTTRPYCRMCGSNANVVDHIIPHRGNDRLFWDRTNWQPLCTPCHNRVKQRQERST